MDLKLLFKNASGIMSTDENSLSFSGRKKLLHSFLVLLMIISAGSLGFAASPVKASAENHYYLAQDSDSEPESDEYVPESGNDDYGNDTTDSKEEVPGDIESGSDEEK